MGQKNEVKSNGGIIFNNNKYNSIIPMNITSSNTTKNYLIHQPYFIFNKSNNNNFEKIPNISNENKEKIKNNYINLIEDKKQNKKKYTNLLNKFVNGKIKAYYQGILDNNNNLLKYDIYGLNTLKKSNHLRISSSIVSHRNYSLMGVSSSKKSDKNWASFHVQRSKSTGRFLKLGKQNKLSPKTPNRELIFPRNVEEGEKQQRFYNLFSGFSFSNTTRHQQLKNNGNSYGEYKYKRSKSSKRK